MQAKVIISFEHLSEPAFLVRVQTIDGSFDDNPHFPQPWPAMVAGPAEIKADVAAYGVAYHDAKDGDRAKIKVRKAQRKALSAKLKRVGAYAELVANGNESVLATTGFELRQDIVRSNVPLPPPEPRGLKVARGVLSGTLLIHARALPNVNVYELQIAAGDPSAESSWSDAGTHTRCNRIDLTGLAPNKVVYVRLRGFNKHGHGVWATSAGVLVL